MENRAHALAAGLFLLLLGLAVAAAGWWFAGKREATRDYLVVSSRAVTGLNNQASVRYRGVRTGKVQDIDLDPRDPRNILITVRIDADIPVTRSTTAQLNFQGVTGLAYVQLDDSGESREPLTAPEGELPRIALQASQFDQLSEAATAILGQSRQLIERLNMALDDGNLGRLRRTLANLERASGQAGDVLQEMPAVLAGLREALSDANIRRLHSVLDNAERASREAAPLAADLRKVLGRMDELGRRLDGLSREMGMEVMDNTLPRVHDLLQELAVGSRQLQRVLDGLEQSPQSLIFGRTAEQPGPGEAGFDPRRK